MVGGEAWLELSQAVEPDRAEAANGETGLLEHLRQAVSRMRPGAGCALSGGLDSGLVLALMSEGGEPPHAYTLVTDFGDPAELRAARTLAARRGTAHVLVHVPEEALPDHVGETVRACEEPIWNAAAVARHLFFRKVRGQGDSALLSGVGADELLCGNPEAMRAWPERLRALGRLGETLLTDGARRELRERAVAAETPATGADLEGLRRGFVLTLLPDSTLPPECRTSAAEGIEARLPYLEPCFARAALSLPASLCVQSGVGKWPLREAARGLVPEAIRAAPKAARLAPSGGGSARARRRWLELFASWLTPDRLAPLECVDDRHAAALLDRFAAGETSDPARAIQDAVLLRLASLAILAATA